MTITPDETAVLALIDPGALVRDLGELVAIPSTGGTAAELDAQAWCADRLTTLGFDVDRWDIDIDDLRAEPDFPGMEVARDRALGCVGVFGPTDEIPALALCGHTDVVPAGDLRGWPSDPFAMRVADGVASGRGTCDMKAGLVAAMAALAAVARSGVALAKPVAIHCVSGEEDGGVGAYATLRRGHRAAACVIAEPTSGQVIPANAGALTFRLEITGLATHGSTRTRGVSAIDKFEVINRALRDLERERNADVSGLFGHLDLAWPLSIGIVSAGDWASTVPDRLVAEGRYGVGIDETMPAAIAAFEQAVAAACAADPWLVDHPVEITWPGGMFAPGALALDDPLIGVTSRAVTDVRGAPPRVVGAPYGSDLRHYIAAGVPTLQYGPGDVRYAHATDEHVVLADVLDCARVFALLALRQCGAGT